MVEDLQSLILMQVLIGILAALKVVNIVTAVYRVDNGALICKLLIQNLLNFRVLFSHDLFSRVK